MNSLMSAPLLSDIYEVEALVRRLGRSASYEAMNLALILSQCKPDNPCLSGACIVCGRRLQTDCCKLVDEHMRGISTQVRENITAYCLFSEHSLVEERSLNGSSISTFRNHLLRILENLKFSPSIFCIDITLNDEPPLGYEPHWCIHLRGLTLDRINSEQKGKLKHSLSQFSQIRQPVYTQPLDEKLKGVTYMFKPERGRRERYFITPIVEQGIPFSDPSRRALLSKQAVELALAEHQFGLGQRVFTLGIDRRITECHLGRYKKPTEVSKQCLIYT